MFTFALITIIFAVAFFVLKMAAAKKKEGQTEPDSPSAKGQPGDLHNCIWGENAFIKTFTPAQAAPGATPDEAARQTRGKIGEQHVMSRLYRVPGTAVYWNVGIDFGERRCELDHLVLTPEGIILVECKNLRGTWKAVGDDDHPNQWTRVDSNEKRIRRASLPCSVIIGLSAT